jgi:enamine deaminase RidA (YjgF/YER057c/UK114 family)
VNFKPDDRATITALRQRYLPAENPPASTLVGVQALARPDLLVEIEAVAVLP